MAQPAVYRYFLLKNVAQTVYFATQDVTDTDDLYIGTAFAAGDAKISLAGAAVASTTNAPAQVTASQPLYKLDLTAAETNAAEILITIRDQTEPEVFEPVFIHITTQLQLGTMTLDPTGGGATGTGLSIKGAGAAAATIVCSSSNGDGLTITGSGTGNGIAASSGTSAAANQGALQLICASGSGGAALQVIGNAASVVGAIIKAVSGADGLQITGNAAGHAVKLSPGSTARGLEIASTSTQSELTHLRKNTAAAGAAGTITLDGSASAVDDFYNEMRIVIIGGTGVGQSRVISDYVGATKVASVARNWSTTPDNTSVFMIIHGADIWDCLEGSQPSSAIAANTTFRLILQFIKRLLFNKVTQTSTTETLYKDDASTSIMTAAVSDDGTTQTKGAFS